MIQDAFTLLRARLSSQNVLVTRKTWKSTAGALGLAVRTGHTGVASTHTADNLRRGPHRHTVGVLSVSAGPCPTVKNAETNP